jgi:hypothetical protein
VRAVVRRRRPQGGPIEPGGVVTRIASGARNGPWTGVVFAGGAFYVAEGGQLEGGRILKIAPDGAITRLVEGLPSHGDHHTNGPAIGPDALICFGQGTATNSGVVGEDSAEFGWLARFPGFHDLLCRDVTLTGATFESGDPLSTDQGRRVRTRPFAPFGRATERGDVVRAALPCNGAVMRVRPEGGALELVAWGFRNPFGLAFAPDGRLFVTDNGYDDRGSRPVHGAGDLLWAVTPGTWYGWPDFHGARRLDGGDHYVSPGKGTPSPLLAASPGVPPRPVAVFAVHSSSDGFDFSRAPAFGHVGQAFVAQFGDQAPLAGKVLGAVGFKVVRVDVATGVIEEFAANRGRMNGRPRGSQAAASNVPRPRASIPPAPRSTLWTSA